MSEGLWIELVKPKYIEVEEETETYGRFIAEPLEKGYGTTLGNALRRVLLSSLPGAAITAVKIKGVAHEFTSIPHVVEDVTDIILNLKQVRFKVLMPFTKRVYFLKKEGEGPVYAGDIEEDQYIKVVNKDLVIANISGNGSLEMALTVEVGKGYVPVDRDKMDIDEPDLIPIDAIFSPIVKVNYRIDYARVGRMTDYDKLILEVWTDGTIRPKRAVRLAVDILMDQLSIFKQEKSEEPEEEEEEEESFDEIFFKTIEDLELPARTVNSLRSAGIEYIGELVRLKEEDILNTKNFGKKSLEEIKKALEAKGLSLGMELDWFPKSKDEIQRIRAEKGIEE